MSYLLLQADAGRIPLPDRSIHAVVTSPPYFNQRDYGTPGQIGREETPTAFVAALVRAFREVRRVLRDDGSIWVNMGDSFFGGGGYYPDAPSNQPDAARRRDAPRHQVKGARIKGRGRMAFPSRYRLRPDLTPAQIAYVVAELARTLSISSDTQEARP